MDNLKHLISAYFYELWNQYEYSTWEDAVDDFIKRSPERAGDTPAEIDDLLSTATDERIEVRLAEFGFDHRPVHGLRAWLGAVRDRITSQLGHSRSAHKSDTS